MTAQFPLNGENGFRNFHESQNHLMQKHDGNLRALNSGDPMFIGTLENQKQVTRGTQSRVKR